MLDDSGEEDSETDEDGNLILELEEWIQGQTFELTTEVKMMFTRPDKGQAFFERFLSYVVTPNKDPPVINVKLNDFKLLVKG